MKSSYIGLFLASSLQRQLASRPNNIAKRQHRRLTRATMWVFESYLQKERAESARRRFIW